MGHASVAVQLVGLFCIESFMYRTGSRAIYINAPRSTTASFMTARSITTEPFRMMRHLSRCGLCVGLGGWSWRWDRIRAGVIIDCFRKGDRPAHLYMHAINRTDRRTHAPSGGSGRRLRSGRGRRSGTRPRTRRGGGSLWWIREVRGVGKCMGRPFVCITCIGRKPGDGLGGGVFYIMYFV